MADELSFPAAPGPDAPEESVRILLERAHRLGDDGDFAGMAEVLREGLAEHPGDPFVLCWLGVAEREMGLDGVAYERFRACLAARPGDPHVLATAGNAVAAFDDPEAEPELRTAALLNPDLTLARWLYGAWLTREGMVEDGLRELSAARDLDPENGAVRYELGVGLALAGRRTEAVDDLYRAVELAAVDDGWADIVLGLLLVEEERAEEAAGVLETGARLRPEDVEAQVLAALALAAVGAEDGAFEMLERARQWAEGIDRTLVDEVETRLDEGAEAAQALLLEQLAPSILRERMMVRP